MLNIIFMGTPDFAVPCLKSLHTAGHRISLVITQPDRRKGRGRKTMPSPVKSAVSEIGCPIIQPVDVRENAAIQTIADYQPDLLVVVAYGQLLPQSILSIPAIGAVNVHASLLPKYRGAAPIQWAVVNGEKKTGVTTMLLDAGMDTGDILMARPTPIGPEDTAGALHDRLAEMGADLLLETVAAMEQGKCAVTPQDHSSASYAPMLKKSDGRIDWRQPAEKIECQIRGMNPWPGAFTFFGKRRLKLLSAGTKPIKQASAPGTVIPGFDNELRIATGDQALTVFEIQPDSGKRMPIESFLRGCPISPGSLFQ